MKFHPKNSVNIKKLKIFGSVRARLTFWYTSVFALVLIVFALSAYAFLAHTVEQETDATLAFMASEFAASFAHEVDEHPEQTINWAANSGASLFGDRYREFAAAIYDPRSQSAIAFVSRLPEEAFSGDSNDAAEDTLAALAASGNLTASAQTLPNQNSPMRFFTADFPVAGKNYTFVVAQPLAAQNAILRQARTALLVGIPFALLLAGCGGYFLARKTLKPVVAMSNRAGEIQAANLHLTRLPITNPDDELGHLAQTFNRMLERLDVSMEQQRRFMAEASHELRTPIAIVRCESEVTLGKERRSEEEYRQSFSIVCDESRRMTRIVEDLFLLARADSGQYPLTLSNFYLEETLAECARALKTLAQMRDVKISVPSNIEIPFRGDEALIRRLFLNLLDNAVKHTPPGGSLTISIEPPSFETYRITIADTGTGISATDQPRIFERFFRGLKSRSRTLDEQSYAGAGLGLSIACWICDIHRGKLELVRSDDSGSTFSVALPITS